MSRRPFTDNELIAYAAGDLSGEAATAIERALKADADAARRVRLYRLAAETVASDDTVAPPLESIRRAKAIFAPRPQTSGPSWPQRLEALIATLVYDSRLQPAAVRHTDVGARFQATYEVDDVEIELQGERAPDGSAWRLMGQVSSDDLDADGAGGAIEVELIPTRRTTPVVRSTADERVFTLDVAEGVYDLRLVRGERMYLVSGLEIR